MNYNLILALLINIQYYSARNYNLTCIYDNFEIGNYIHCVSLGQLKLISEYDKCETKPLIDLEYYQCIYKIYKIPTEQATLFGKLHMKILKCKDCEYTRNWKFKNPKLCTNKAEAEYYESYNDCLLNYIDITDEEINKRKDCTRGCNKNLFSNIAGYSNCSYGCYKDINKRIVESEPKITTFVNNTQTNENNNVEDKKSSALPNNNSLSIYSVILLSLITSILIT